MELVGGPTPFAYARRRVQLRNVLYLPNGERAAPAMVVTAIPPWREGDTFLAGPDLTTFRSLDIEPNMDEPTRARPWHAVWTVEVAR